MANYPVSQDTNDKDMNGLKDGQLDLPTTAPQLVGHHDWQSPKPGIIDQMSSFFFALWIFVVALLVLPLLPLIVPVQFLKKRYRRRRKPMRFGILRGNDLL